MNSSPGKFENAVRDYIAGNVDWETVHQLAVDMEYRNEAAFPTCAPLQELHTIFLTADSKDDSQFRADRQEIVELLAAADKLRGEQR
jgi:hypothetical protein